MGFFDNLLKKETRKIIASVVDSVVDNVADNLGDAIKGTADDTADVNSSAVNTQKAAVDTDEEDCRCNKNVIRQRIEKIAADEYSDLELRKNISASELSAEAGAYDYTYGFYRNGVPVAMLLILSGRDEYRCKAVRLSREACRNSNVGYVHFLAHMPNRKSYISAKLKEIIA